LQKVLDLTVVTDTEIMNHQNKNSTVRLNLWHSQFPHHRANGFIIIF